MISGDLLRDHFDDGWRKVFSVWRSIRIVWATCITDHTRSDHLKTFWRHHCRRWCRELMEAAHLAISQMIAANPWIVG